VLLVVDLALHLCIIKATEMPPLFLIRGLLLAIPAISTIFTISPVICVDFPIILLLLRGPFAVGLKKPSPGLRSLNAYISDYKQIGHHSELLHGDLLHSLHISDSVTKNIDDLDVLNVRDGIAEMFHIIPEALIMLLLDGLQNLSSGWTLICTLEVPNKYGTQLIYPICSSSLVGLT
jgi:hypothetical protein